MTEKSLRIVYMGTPDFAVAPLRALVEGGYNVVGVVTTPDKPAGRGLKVHESAVKKYAGEANLNILQPEKLKSPQFIEELKALNADLGIVVAFRMLPEIIWSMPQMGTFNLHASLLPQYRGAAPINWALINGETVTGVTTFFLNDRIDEGAIIDSREVTIKPEDNAGTLHDKLMNVGTGLVLDTVDAIAEGTADSRPQDFDASQLKPAPKIFKETCRIDFSRNGENIKNLVRGLSPYPAAWAYVRNMSDNSQPVPVKIFSVLFEAANDCAKNGSVLSDGKNYIKVRCADGSIDIKELQLAGKKRMTVQEFLRGFKDISDSEFY